MLRKAMMMGLLSASSVVYAADHEVFGALKGSLSVNAGGVLSYSIPLELPKSRGGFSPSMSIEYSSQIDDGELGVGFRLSGDNSVTRCAQTIEQDGVAGRISYDEPGDTGTGSGIKDRFCLGGQRLILVSGLYGYNGSEYRTEIDTQQRIKFFSPVSPALSYFTVESKDGVTSLYGGTGNSLRKTTELAAPKVASWLLRKVTDRNSNFYEYEYVGTSIPGAEQLLSKVSYGANASVPVSFDYEVSVEYEDRPDKTKKYANSIKFLNEKRISQIKINHLSVGGVLKSKYKISYLQGVASEKSRVDKIEHCNKKALSSDFDCVAPVQFAWTDLPENDAAWQQSAAMALPVDLFIKGSTNDSARPRYIRFVDLDGDGRNDIIWSTLKFASSASVVRGAYLNTPTGWQSAPEYFLPATDPRGGAPATVTQYNNDNLFNELGSAFVDLNGDGLVDFIYRYAVPAYNQTVAAYGAYIQKPGNGTTSSRWQYEAKYEPPANLFFKGLYAGYTPPRFVDVNGDGLLDLLYRAEGFTGGYTSLNGSYALINTPTATGSSYWVADNSYLLPMPIYVNTTANITNTATSLPGDIGTRFVDLNGDGLLDFIYYRAINGTVQKRAYINNQYGAADSAGWVCDSANNNTYTSGGGSKWVCNDAYMPPAPMHRDETSQSPLVSVFPKGDLGVRFVDLNNDGLQDFIVSKESTYDDQGNQRPSPVIVSDAYLNTGSGWSVAPEFVLPIAPEGAVFPGRLILTNDTGIDFGRYFVDVNGDGLVDFVYNWKDVNGQNQTQDLDAGTYINTGSGWRRDNKYISPCPLNSLHYKSWGSRLDDINGDGIADVACKRTDVTNGSGTYLGKPRVDLLKTITDGMGAVTELTFAAISSGGAIYARGATSSYPDPEIGKPVYVASKTVSPAETADGTVVTRNYAYSGLKTNLRGRGVIGFGRVTETTEFPVVSDSLDSVKWIETLETEYSQTFPYYGFVIAQKQYTQKGAANPVLVKDLAINPATNLAVKNPFPGVYLPYMKGSVETVRDPESGDALYTKAVAREVDSYGNVTSLVDGHIRLLSPTFYAATATTNTYLSPDLSSWQIDRLDKETKIFERTGLPTKTQVRQQTYHANGLLKDVIQEPDVARYRLTEAFSYDAFGNVLSRTLSGNGDVSIARSGIASRAETFMYSAGSGHVAGVFPVQRSNAKGQATNYEYDPVTGSVLSETDANGVKLITERDAFGLVKAHKKQVGASVKTMATMDYAVCGGAIACQPGEAYRAVTTPLGAAPVEAYFDRLGRELRRVTKAYDANPLAAQPVVTGTVYDSRGLKICESRPMSGTVPLSCASLAGRDKWTRYKFDGVRRVLQKSEPAGSTSIAYSGLVSTTTNALGQSKTEEKNPLGETVAITDAAAKTTTFKYDATGGVTEVRDPLNNVVLSSYDILGRKSSMTDPDMGVWEYAYNVAGEMIRQKDAKNQIAEIYYDQLGRMTKREGADLVGEWAFDSSAHGIGKLAQSTASNGYQKSLTYDAWGRLVQSSTLIDGTNYVISTDYDVADRVQSVTYPSGLKYQNTYDTNGYLVQVQDATAGAPSHPVYWLAGARDEEGRITHEVLGNGIHTERSYYPDSGRVNTIQAGPVVSSSLQPTVQNDSYSFNPLGNLTSRNQLVAENSFSEFYEYDDLNRIKLSHASNGAHRMIEYDAIGNLKKRSDVGTYSYTGCGGTHRVCSISGTLNTSFSYDANGNMTSGNGRTYTWASFNMPASIVRGSGSESFLYDPDHERVRRTSVDNGQTTVITYLNPRIDLGATYEKANKPDGSVEHTQHIYADGRVIGAVVKMDSAPNSPVTRYFHQDHIGSITAISDGTGAVEYLSYDTWGRRRALNGGDEPVTSPVSDVSGIQPTGLDRYELIQQDGVTHELTFHTWNRLKAFPVALGQSVPVAHTMRLGMEVQASALNPRQRSFLAAIENTAAGTANYRRFGAYASKGRWMLHTCSGTAACQEVSLGEGTVQNGATYVVEIIATPVSAQLRIYDKNAAQPIVLQDIRSWDMSAGGAVTHMQPSLGVQLKGNFLPIAGIMLPIKRPDAPSKVAVLAWDRLTEQFNEYAASGSRHGFTAHEHLDDMDLVHMNGRVYDPLIARFLSPDPNVFYPENPQDYNRYSYVWNNPLSLTDPDGFRVNGTAGGYTSFFGSSYGSGMYNFSAININAIFGASSYSQVNDFQRSGISTVSGVGVGNRSKQTMQGILDDAKSHGAIYGEDFGRIGFNAGVSGQPLMTSLTDPVDSFFVNAQASRQHWQAGETSSAIKHGALAGFELFAIMPIGKLAGPAARSVVAKSGAESAKQAADLSKHLRYSEKYGQAGVKELENGRIRYYGDMQPASKSGEMAGRRYVHEFDPATGRSRGWHETLDHSGSVRQVRPEMNSGTKTHYTFGRDGSYTGSW